MEPDTQTPSLPATLRWQRLQSWISLLPPPPTFCLPFSFLTSLARPDCFEMTTTDDNDNWQGVVECTVDACQPFGRIHRDDHFSLIKGGERMIFSWDDVRGVRCGYTFHIQWMCFYGRIVNWRGNRSPCMCLREAEGRQVFGSFFSSFSPHG